MANAVRIKRVYEPQEPQDGLRVLVDRIWPRGLKKEAAALDHWLKEIAPSNELRRWFDHAPARWPGFKARYARELAGNAALDELHEALRQGPVTLLFAARDRLHNNASALASYLEDSGAGLPLPARPRAASGRSRVKRGRDIS